MDQECVGLVIDDDHDAVDVMYQYLESSNICIAGCGFNGKDAFDLYKKFNPQFVILDMKMPEYDGFYALDNLFKTENHPKIIIISGQISVDVKKLQNYNDVSLVKKPFNLQLIANTIQGKNTNPY